MIKGLLPILCSFVINFTYVLVDTKLWGMGHKKWIKIDQSAHAGKHVKKWGIRKFININENL